MKLIEALKQTKDLQRKANDLRDLVKNHCAISSLETQKYPTGKSYVFLFFIQDFPGFPTWGD